MVALLILFDYLDDIQIRSLDPLLKVRGLEHRIRDGSIFYFAFLYFFNRFLLHFYHINKLWNLRIVARASEHIKFIFASLFIRLCQFLNVTFYYFDFLENQ